VIGRGRNLALERPRITIVARNTEGLGLDRFLIQQLGGIAPERGFPDRYLLHAESVRFYHPRLKTAIELQAPLPMDFRELIDSPILR
jgi:hypothetical protein